jgi:hypothetical protein
VDVLTERFAVRELAIGIPAWLGRSSQFSRACRGNAHEKWKIFSLGKGVFHHEQGLKTRGSGRLVMIAKLLIYSF